MPRLALVLLVLTVGSRSMAESKPELFPLSGDVVQPSGAPVAGATVRAFFVGDVMGVPFPAGFKEATTDPKGHFAIAGLPRAKYWVVAERVEGKVRWAAQQSVELSGPQSVRLQVVAMTKVNLVGVCEDGTPLTHTQFTLAPVPPGDGAKRSGDFNADGVASIDDLPAGTYQVTFERSASHDQAQQQLEVTATTTTAELRIPCYPRLRGRFVDEQGRPVAGAHYELSGAGDGTAPQGEFAIIVAQPDQPAVLRFGAPGHQNRVLQVPAGAARTAGLGDVQLPAALPLTISVRAASGAPVAGATVVMHLRHEGPLFAWEPRAATTNAEGVAELDSYDGSIAELSAFADGFQTGHASLEAPARHAELVLQPLPPRDVALTVSVTDATGKPMMAMVTAGDTQAQTDARGQVALQTAGGWQVVQVQAPVRLGYWSTRFVEVAAGKPAKLAVMLPTAVHTLTVHAPWAIFGALMAGSGAPPFLVNKWKMMPFGMDPLGSQGASTQPVGANGTFTFSSAPGASTLVLIDRKHKPHELHVDLPDADKLLELPAP